MKFDTLYEKLLNGLAKGMSLQDIADKHNVNIDTLNKQLDMGIEVEMEHTSDKDMAKEIAMDHLAERPDYYSEIKKAGL